MSEQNKATEHRAKSERLKRNAVRAVAYTLARMHAAYIAMHEERWPRIPPPPLPDWAARGDLVRVHEILGTHPQLAVALVLDGGVIYPEGKPNGDKLAPIALTRTSRLTKRVYKDQAERIVKLCPNPSDVERVVNKFENLADWFRARAEGLDRASAHTLEQQERSVRVIEAVVAEAALRREK